MITIIIPNYNKELYLKELLDSLNKQLNNQCEIIFIDDGSTDKSVSIVKEHPIYKKENFNFIENKTSLWVSFCRNLGITKAKGDYITFMDSDDVALDNYIETLIKYSTLNHNVCVFDYLNIPVDGSSADEIEKADNPMCWLRLYKKQFLLENNLFFLEKWKEIGFGEDYDFNERVVASTEDIYITNDVIYGYH